MNKISITFLLAILLFSCKTEKKEITKADLIGFYEQQGEGEIIEFNDSLVVFYNSSTFNCYPYWKMPRKEFNTNSPSVKLIDENTFTNEKGFTIFTYKKLHENPTICKDLTEDQINNHTYNFETLWHTFNNQYAFFKERNIDWNAIKGKYQSQFTDETPPFEFYLLLEKMVLELNDEHSDFDIPDEFDEQWHLLNKKRDTTDYRKITSSKILTKYVVDAKGFNEGQFYWGLINNEIGYIQLNEMEEIDSINKTIDSIVNDIKDTKFCIIDLRFNGGGSDLIGLDFLSHFIDKDYEVFKKKRRFKNGFAGQQTIDINPSKNNYTGNVYMLTSPYTVSAAETTILATMNFPNFKRIGSNTNGAFSDILYKKLPNGWTYWMSNEVYEGMNGKMYEVVGIPPDYKIEYPRDKDELFKSMNIELETKDRAIEKVIDLTK